MKPNLKPFDLAAAKAGAPVVTRDGHSARIVCFDAEQDYPIVALIKLNDGMEYTEIFTDKGAWSINHDNCRDLFIAPGKRQGWVNLYRKRDNNMAAGGIVYESRDVARDRIEALYGHYAATVPVEWEE